jgi:periplasmic divalent cation tolerance protein
MADEILVFVTCPATDSERIASELVEHELAACVNIVSSVTSIYRWQGEICRDSEHLLIVKSVRNLWQTLERKVREIHPYDVPEVIAFAIDEGHGPYLSWLTNSVRSEVQSK